MPPTCRHGVAMHDACARCGRTATHYLLPEENIVARYRAALEKIVELGGFPANEIAANALALGGSNTYGKKEI